MYQALCQKEILLKMLIIGTSNQCTYVHTLDFIIYSFYVIMYNSYDHNTAVVTMSRTIIVY